MKNTNNTNNEQMTIDEPQFNPEQIAMVVLGVIGVIIAFVIGQNIIAAMPTTDEKYISKTPNFEQAYQKMLQRHDAERCEAEKAIAKSNWDDVSNGVQVEKDMNVIKEKMAKDCLAFYQPTS